MYEKRPYLGGREIEMDPAGFAVITPVDFEEPIPLACPVCETLLRNSDDEESFLRSQCCFRCDLAWAAPRRAEWATGWRPTEDQILTEMSFRPPLSSKLKIDIYR
jgi:hypothetical protein